VAGGGVCLVSDPARRKVEELDFLPPAALTPNGTPSGVALPALPRGLFTLQVKYGHLHWEKLVAPAEQLARLGTPASRAFVGGLVPQVSRLGNDLEARRIFFVGDKGLEEGQSIRQSDLGGLLGRLRVKGAGELYAGQLAIDFVNQARSGGVNFDPAQLRDYHPQWRAPASFQLGTLTGYNTALTGEGASGDQGGTGLVVKDAAGQTVACGLTLNGSFGNGHIVPGTGLFLALPPSGGADVGAAIATDAKSSESRYAFASGGSASAGALATTALRASVAQTQGAAVGIAAAAQGSASGRVNGAACPAGDDRPKQCAAATDPRGSGLGERVGE